MSDSELCNVSEIVNHEHECIPEEYDKYMAEMQRMNKKHAIVMLGSDCLVMNEFFDPIHKRHDVNFSTFGAFKNRYLNRRVINPWRSASARKTRDAGSMWLESRIRREYERVVFDPSQSVGKNYYNMFKGFNVRPDKRGDWSTLRSHIFEVLCEKNKKLDHYLMSWMARIIQQPGGDKPGTAIVFKGIQGCGKGTLANALSFLIGAHARHILQAAHLTGQFNSTLKDALFVFCDEITWGGNKQAEGILKGLITEPTISIEHKGKDVAEMDSHLNVMIASNNDWVIPAGLEERRFCVMSCSPEKAGNRAYFDRIYHELKHKNGYGRMMYDLMHYDYSDIDLRTIPRTRALFDQILASMSPVHKFWYQILADETLDPQEDYWRGDIETTRLYNLYQDFSVGIGHSYRLIPNQFARKLKELCPDMRKMRVRADDLERKMHYVFPDLQVCRNQFEQAISMKIDWSL